ncbi:hypothetical protein GLOTRDRAFT_140052 [Gloeophyllum trabeum ATCC 11539]|uniref:FHA domain-containing protein n=1 Tax=Gloeophyllum trabeum (strain ATCC 11539 / FP-39264 / Madison 617) TaxID=670483 RepID=S7Q0U2_GLOTA|nr:uncharacterized protein GLOTRDRAFT_140052 [Gloeophyllum trabeum ATCC 11539]EPQ53127.1 hypothetical protein GLOTRDRAFT_140052 [Gloeophyllum trabeum ATCC 11539]
MDIAEHFVGESQAQGRRVTRSLPQRAVTGVKLYIEKNGDQPSRVMTFSKSQTITVKVGRKSAATFEEDCWPADEAMFRCPVVSRKHAKIVFSDAGNAYVMDLGSHHGTHILKPGEVVSRRLKAQTPATLSDGDVVTFGKTVKTDNELVRPVTARIQLLHDTISDRPITFRRVPSKAAPSSSTTSPVKPSSGGRFGLFYSSSSSDEEPSRSDKERDSDVEEVPRPGPSSAAQPLEELVTLNRLEGNRDARPDLSARLPSLRALNINFNPIWRRIMAPHMPLAALSLPAGHTSLDDVSSDIGEAEIDSDYNRLSSSPERVCVDPSEAGDVRSVSRRSSPVEKDDVPWRDTSYFAQGNEIQERGSNEGDNLTSSRSDHDILPSVRDSFENMSQDIYESEDAYIPSLGQSGNRYTEIDDEHPEYASASQIAEENTSNNPSRSVSSSSYREGEEVDGQGAPDHSEFDRFIYCDMEISSPSVVSLSSRASPVHSESEPARNTDSPAVPVTGSDLQANLTAFDEGLRDLKIRLETHIAATKETLETHDHRVAGVKDLCSSLSERLTSEMPADISTRVKDVEDRVSEFQAEIQKNAEYWSSTAGYREEFLENLETVKKLAGDMRALQEVMSAELASELQALRDARTGASQAARQLQVEAQRLHATRPLKRKRCRSLIDEADVGGGMEVDEPRPAKRNRILSSVVGTATAVTIGAVATWSALAFT